jgi:hypothetical protein
MTSNRTFNAVSLVTFLLAHAVWQAQRSTALDLRGLILLALVYGFSLWMRDRFYDEKTTFFDVDSRALPVKDEGLIIFGEKVEDLAHESRERRLLISLVDFGGQKYKIYLSWIASVVVAVYFQFRIGGIDNVQAGASFLILSGIYFSPFMNQRLVPLFIAFALSLYAFGRSSDLKVILLFWAGLLAFFYSIVLYRDVTSDRVNPDRKFSGKRRMKSVALMVLATIVIYGLADFFVPDENPFQRKLPGTVVDAKQHPRMSTERISREFAEQLVKLGERNSEADLGPQGSEQGRPDEGASGPSSSKPSDGQGDESPEAEAGTSADGNPESSTGRAADARPAANSKMSSRSNGKTSDSGGRMDSQNQSQSQSQDQSASEDQAPRDNSPPSAAGAHDSKDQTENSASRGDSPSEGGGAEQSEAGGSRGDGDGAAETKAAGGVKPSAEKRAQKGVSREEKQKKREEKVRQVQKDLRLPIELAKGFIFLVLAGVTVFALFRYFSKPKAQEEEVIRQQLTTKQKQKLQTLLQRIKARGLSPSDEVVETYNALLTVFELGHHPREEWLPAEDFSNEIARSIPTLSGPFRGATARFSKTLYGNKSVDPRDLEKFRAEVSQVLKFFQLS